MKENRQEICNASCCLGKSISGPPENLICPGDRTVLQPVPAEAPGPITAKPVCPVPELLAPGRMNALRQGRRRKLPQLWGLLTWKLNRAARAQRYQVPESPRSVVTKPVAPLSKKTIAVTGVSEEEMIKSFCQPRKCRMAGHQVIHEFLYILSAQYPC